MTKPEFNNILKKSLPNIPADYLNKSIEYYNEMIDDRIDAGLTEAEAIKDLGSIEEIKNSILEEVPLTKIVKEKITPKHKLKAWEIVLLIFASPILISLLAVGLAVIAAFVAVIISIAVALWAIDLSLLCSMIMSILAAVFSPERSTMIFFIGTTLASTGLTVLLFCFNVFATKNLYKATKFSFKKLISFCKNIIK